MQQNGVTQEEIQAELDAMESTGRHYTPRKSINRKVNTHRNAKIITIVVLLLVLLLSAFVWLSSLYGEMANKGYLININDVDIYNGSGDALELAFDPTFDDKYHTLVGLGYGDVASVKGGSLFSDIEMNTTMFQKFKNFAENEEVASTYEGNEGSANFDQYYCNKYYLRNNGNETIYYRLNLKITQNKNDALHAARFMIVTGEEDTGYDYQIFATRNRDNGKSEIAAAKEVKTATYNGFMYFTDPNTSNTDSSKNLSDAWLCSDLVKDEETGFYHYYSAVLAETGEVLEGEFYALEPGQSVCYTICIWFEGSDPDHNNSIIGGGIEFSINYETSDYLKFLYEVSKRKED